MVVKPVIEEGFDFVTEAPIPTVEEINCEPEFCAEIISKEKFEEMAARMEARDIPLKAAYEMAQKRDEEAISVYLSDNYKRNCRLAKFCMK